MAKWRVEFIGSISQSVKVEAKTIKQAIEIGQKQVHFELCHSCCKGKGDWQIDDDIQPDAVKLED